MKSKLITILYLFSLSAFAAGENEKVTVETTDTWLNIAPPQALDIESVPQISVVVEKKSYDCHLDSLSKMYICPDEKSPVLIRYNNFGFSALKKNEEQKAEIVNITSAKAGDIVLFDNSFFEGNLGTFVRSDDLSNDITKQLFAIDGFFELMQSPLKKPTPRTIGSEEYESIVKSYLDRKAELEKLAKTIFRENNFQVKLADGKTINCSRGARRSLTDQENDWQKSFNSELQCGAFKCDKINIDGKEYQASMLYESIPGGFASPSIHITDDKGLGPKTSIRSIHSPNSKKPLVDYSNFLDNPNSTSGYLPYPGMQAVPNPFPESITTKNYAKYKDSNFENSLEYNKNICEKGNEAISNISKDNDNVKNEIANTELVQFITVLSNGELLGHYVDPNEAMKTGCMYGGVYLNAGAAKNLDAIKKNLYPDQHVDKTISLDRATELFNKARAMKDIAWDYKQDGCYARAHLMARRFEAEGVRVDKAWLKGDLYLPGTNIAWNFHVAPVVYVKDKEGIVKKMVIDPSVFDKPVTVEEWDQKIAKRTIKGTVVTAFPFPENATQMERAALAFSSSDPYKPSENINLSEEAKMKMADDTMTQYRGDKSPANDTNLRKP